MPPPRSKVSLTRGEPCGVLVDCDAVQSHVSRYVIRGGGPGDVDGCGSRRRGLHSSGAVLPSIARLPPSVGGLAAPRKATLDTCPDYVEWTAPAYGVEKQGLFLLEYGSIDRIARAVEKHTPRLRMCHAERRFDLDPSLGAYSRALPLYAMCCVPLTYIVNLPGELMARCGIAWITTTMVLEIHQVTFRLEHPSFIFIPCFISQTSPSSAFSSFLT